MTKNLPHSGSRTLCDMHDLQRVLNLCRTSVEKLLRTDPEFPAPMMTLDKRQWFLDEIEAYKASRPRRIYAAVVAVLAVVGIAALSFANSLLA